QATANAPKRRRRLRRPKSFSDAASAIPGVTFETPWSHACSPGAIDRDNEGRAVSQESRSDLETLPILPLRNSVVFPASVVPINVGRARSVRLVEDLLGQDRAVVGIVSQKDSEVDEPGFEDIFDV